MKHKLFQLGFFFFTFSAFVACKKDDPVLENENELIDEVQIQFTTDSSSQTFSWTVDQQDTIRLQPEKTYTVSMSFLGQSEDVTEEIVEESDEHQIVFTLSPENLGQFVYEDQDVNGQPIGLSTSYTTPDNSQSGILNVVLRHYPEGKSSGFSTDADVDFPIVIE